MVVETPTRETTTSEETQALLELQVDNLTEGERLEKLAEVYTRKVAIRTHRRALSREVKDLEDLESGLIAGQRTFSPNGGNNKSVMDKSNVKNVEELRAKKGKGKKGEEA